WAWSRSAFELNDHRLEGGGFSSRLKARLLWDPEGTRMPASWPGQRPPNPSARVIGQTQPNVLEVVAWKARDFSSTAQETIRYPVISVPGPWGGTRGRWGSAAGAMRRAGSRVARDAWGSGVRR